MKRFTVAVAALALSACGGSSDPEPTADQPITPITSDEIDTPPDVTVETGVSAVSSEPIDAEPSAGPGSGLLLPLPSATSPEITEDDLHIRIKTLSDDIFEGRAPGTPTGENSAEWIAQEMERIGLKPGNDGSFMQTVEMVEQTIDPSQSSIEIISTVLGEDDAQNTITPVLPEDAVIWTKRQNADEVAVDATDVVFVGYGVNAPEYGWNDYEGIDVTGKTVLILVNDPGYANPDEPLFKGRAMTYYGRWTYKFEEAARQGAAAAFVIHETAPASYGWNIVSSSWTGAQADLVRNDQGTGRVAIEGWFHLDFVQKLFDLNGLGYQPLKAAAAQPGFKAIGMPNTKLSGNIVQTIDRRSSNNVVGIVEGTERPDEFLLFTAHWDHLGMKSGAGDTIYNGAVDNATGTAAILEIAEQLAANPPERSAMFLAVTLEESGLLGSAYYAENPLVPLNKTIAGVNIDAMLPTGPSKDMVVIGYGASELEDRLKDVLDTQDRTIIPDAKPEAGFFYRSDHISLAKKGVPMLYADGGIDLVEGGVAAGLEIANNYTSNDYHAPSDEYSEDWDLTGMVQNVSVLYDVSLGILNSEDWPTWYEGNEFKAIREASLAEAN